MLQAATEVCTPLSSMIPVSKPNLATYLGLRVYVALTLTFFSQSLKPYDLAFEIPSPIKAPLQLGNTSSSTITTGLENVSEIATAKICDVNTSACARKVVGNREVVDDGEVRDVLN
jgi:hypothetical protein